MFCDVMDCVALALEALSFRDQEETHAHVCWVHARYYREHADVVSSGRLVLHQPCPFCTSPTPAGVIRPPAL